MRGSRHLLECSGRRGCVRSHRDHRANTIASLLTLALSRSLQSTLHVSIIFIFIYFSAYFIFEMGYCYAVQVVLELLGTGGPPTSAS